ncbi:MAG: Spy/CpxP family protein refolding chaperone [Candidatus Aminicenantaceae bacterium]
MKKYALGVFLVVFLFSLTFFPDEASAQSERKQGRLMGRSFLFMEKFLDLTPEQKEQLEELRKVRREERLNFQDEIRKMRGEFRELIKDPEANEEKINDIIDKMAQLRANHIKGTIKHRQEAKKIFTPEQLEKIEKFEKKFSELRGKRSQRYFQRGRHFRRGHFPFRRGFRRPWRRGWDFMGGDFDFDPDSQ